jgi:hypothetical protein
MRETSADWRGGTAGSTAPLQEEEIRLRAYYLSLARGAEPGSAFDDWIRAERELAPAPVRG